MELPTVTNKKGISVFFAIDGEYCGFGLTLRKKWFQIKLGFAVFRIYLASEALYNRLITIATIQESPSHEVVITKNNNGVFDESAPRL